MYISNRASRMRLIHRTDKGTIMTRTMNKPPVYRLTSTLAIGGLILALGLQPAHANEVTEALGAAVGDVLVEQGKSAMQNISQELLSETDWAASAAQAQEELSLDPAPASDDSSAQSDGR